MSARSMVRWVASLPPIIALFVATVSVTVAPQQPGHSAVPEAVSVSARAMAGPDAGLLLSKRGSSWTPAPDTAAAAWTGIARLTPPTLWWAVRETPRQQHAVLHRETYRGRAPPATA